MAVQARRLHCLSAFPRFTTPSDGLYHHRTLPVSNAFRRFPVHHRSRATSARREGVGVSNAFRRFPCSPHGKKIEFYLSKKQSPMPFGVSPVHHLDLDHRHERTHQGLQCLSAFSPYGTWRTLTRFVESLQSPMPFGVSPVHHTDWEGVCIALKESPLPFGASPLHHYCCGCLCCFCWFCCWSPMPFGVFPVHHAVDRDMTGWKCVESPMPFGVSPVQHHGRGFRQGRSSHVSNAFRRFPGSPLLDL